MTSFTSQQTCPLRDDSSRHSTVRYQTMDALYTKRRHKSHSTWSWPTTPPPPPAEAPALVLVVAVAVEVRRATTFATLCASPRSPSGARPALTRRRSCSRSRWPRSRVCILFIVVYDVFCMCFDCVSSFREAAGCDSGLAWWGILCCLDGVSSLASSPSFSSDYQ